MALMLYPCCPDGFMAEVLSVAGKDFTLYFAQVLLGYAEVGGDDLTAHAR